MKEAKLFKFSRLNYEVIGVFVLAFAIALSIRSQYLSRTSPKMMQETAATSPFSKETLLPEENTDEALEEQDKKKTSPLERTDGVDFIQKDIANSQYRIAVSYERGLGVPQSHHIAAVWYKSAAALGHKLAQYNLAIFYSKGLGVKKSYANSFKWFSAASDLGLPQAQYNLGYMYEEGMGTKKNLSEAYLSYKKAADAGFSLANNKVKSLKMKVK
ncbi:MAG: tetratricopeptide repeat protein [Alphaproteobacteria bacterium]